MSEKSIAEIAWEIYEEEKRPLHYRELTELVLQRKPLEGKTPEQTVRSAIGTNDRFKRVAEGVYCPAEWDQYPRVRFGKDIAYDILNENGSPMRYRELGLAILQERDFQGSPVNVAYNSTINDSRFYHDKDKRQIGLIEWQNDK